MDRSNRERVGNEDGRLDHAILVYLRPPGDLSSTVQHRNRSRNHRLIDGSFVRDDRSHARSYRAMPRNEWAMSLNERRVANSDAGNIGDRVPLSRSQPTDLDPEVTQPGFQS